MWKGFHGENGLSHASISLMTGVKGRGRLADGIIFHVGIMPEIEIQ
jgi:hypothetical protein